MSFSTLNSLKIAQGVIHNRDLKIFSMTRWKRKYSESFYRYDNYGGSE